MVEVSLEAGVAHVVAQPVLRHLRADTAVVEQVTARAAEADVAVVVSEVAEIAVVVDVVDAVEHQARATVPVPHPRLVASLRGSAIKSSPGTSKIMQFDSAISRV